MACIAFMNLSSTYLFKLIYPIPLHTPSNHAKLKGQAFLYFFAFACIFTLPTIFPPKYTYGTFYSFCSACSNVSSSYDEEINPLNRSNSFLLDPHAFFYHCTYE